MEVKFSPVCYKLVSVLLRERLNRAEHTMKLGDSIVEAGLEIPPALAPSYMIAKEIINNLREIVYELECGERLMED